MTADKSAYRAYRDARMACELAKHLLEAHDFAALLAAIESADAIGPLLDPSLWMEKHVVMDEDRKVFRAAARFISAWEARKTGVDV